MVSPSQTGSLLRPLIRAEIIESDRTKRAISTSGKKFVSPPRLRGDTFLFYYYCYFFNLSTLLKSGASLARGE